MATFRGGSDGGVRGTGPQATAHLWQEVRNEQWPPPAIARRLKERPDRRPVWVAIEWESDGWQWMRGMAVTWDQQHFKVSVEDKRLQVGLVWVVPKHVRRREDDELPLPLWD